MVGALVGAVSAGKRGTSRLIQPSEGALFRVFFSEAQAQHQPTSAGSGEERVAHQVVPGVDPLRSMGSSQGPVAVAQDGEPLVQDVLLRITLPDIAGIGDQPSALEIASLPRAREVVRPVLLAELARADDAKVSACHHEAVRVEYGVLRLHTDPTHLVKHAKAAPRRSTRRGRPSGGWLA
jgi:hypothetical protein